MCELPPAGFFPRRATADLFRVSLKDIAAGRGKAAV